MTAEDSGNGVVPEEMPRTGKKKDYEGPNFIGKLVGKKITIISPTEPSMHCTLVAYNRYELLVEECGVHTIVTKHSISRIRPDKEDPFKDEKKKDNTTQGEMLIGS